MMDLYMAGMWLCHIPTLHHYDIFPGGNMLVGHHHHHHHHNDNENGAEEEVVKEAGDHSITFLSPEIHVWITMLIIIIMLFIIMIIIIMMIIIMLMITIIIIITMFMIIKGSRSLSSICQKISWNCLQMCLAPLNNVKKNILLVAATCSGCQLLLRGQTTNNAKQSRGRYHKPTFVSNFSLKVCKSKYFHFE